MARIDEIKSITATTKHIEIFKRLKFFIPFSNIDVSSDIKKSIDKFCSIDIGQKIPLHFSALLKSLYKTLEYCEYRTERAREFEREVERIRKENDKEFEKRKIQYEDQREDLKRKYNKKIAEIDKKITEKEEKKAKYGCWWQCMSSSSYEKESYKSYLKGYKKEKEEEEEAFQKSLKAISREEANYLSRENDDNIYMLKSRLTTKYKDVDKNEELEKVKKFEDDKFRLKEDLLSIIKEIENCEEKQDEQKPDGKIELSYQEYLEYKKFLEAKGQSPVKK